MLSRGIKYPSFFKQIDIPIFAISWYHLDIENNRPNDNRCINALAFCGGGGSAMTGVVNSVWIILTTSSISSFTRQIIIKTGRNLVLCVKLMIQGKNVFIFFASTNLIEVHLLKSLPHDSLPVLLAYSCIKPNYGVQSLAISHSGKSVVVGCLNGHLLIYHLFHFNTLEDVLPNYVLTLFADIEGHLGSISHINFHPIRDTILTSSSRDGTCRVWNIRSRTCIDVLRCQIPKDGIGSKIFVRACVFGDIDGKSIYTCQSSRKGRGYISLWDSSNDLCDNSLFHEKFKKNVTLSPITAMSISADYRFIVLGDTSGSITVVSIESISRKDSKILVRWNYIHDLPVTGLAARPCSQFIKVPGEEPKGITINFISASADNRIVFLTLQRFPKIGYHFVVTNFGSIYRFYCNTLQLVFAWWFLITIFNWTTISFNICHEFFVGWEYINKIKYDWKSIAYCISKNPFWEGTDNNDPPFISY